MPFNLDNYEPVEDRIRAFYEQHKEGRILTEVLHQSETDWVVKATIYRTPNGDAAPAATGLAQEIIGSTPVNRTSALENCETSAIGRALANLGFAAKGRTSREEMQKVERAETAGSPPVWLRGPLDVHGAGLIVAAVNDALEKRGSKDGRWMTEDQLHRLEGAPQDLITDIWEGIFSKAERSGSGEGAGSEQSEPNEGESAATGKDPSSPHASVVEPLE